MKKIAGLLLATLFFLNAGGWGFYAHRLVNRHAVFMLPPEMLVFYKPNIDFITEHAVDPDKRRYAVAQEGPRHYIDMDRYGKYPYDSLPRNWKHAVVKYTADSLRQHGIVPWWIEKMVLGLTRAFRDKNKKAILKLSAELGHYIGDAHVPLHTSSNHNGQFTGQHGIHGFWESRIPELLAEKDWDLLTGRAVWIGDPLAFTWERVLESAVSADSVLQFEKALHNRFPANAKYAFEERNGLIVKQYSTAYTQEYDRLLGGMTERRLRQTIQAIASLWYTAWVNAGQPELRDLVENPQMPADENYLEDLGAGWQGRADRSCD